MVAAKRILVIVSMLFLLGVVLQFFFAGLALLGGEDWDLHKAFGWSALMLTPVLILVVAYLAKGGRVMLFLCLALVVVSLIQPFWVSEFRDEFLGSMHVLGALVIFTLAHHVSQRAMRELRSDSA
jgi:Family of unknown function (DUF6220)